GVAFARNLHDGGGAGGGERRGRWRRGLRDVGVGRRAGAGGWIGSGGGRRWRGGDIAEGGEGGRGVDRHRDAAGRGHAEIRRRRAEDEAGVHLAVGGCELLQFLGGSDEVGVGDERRARFELMLAGGDRELAEIVADRRHGGVVGVVG